MLKKGIILLITAIVLVQAWSYYLHVQDQRGAQLVADAYLGNLPEVKDLIENGAPLNYELYFYDHERGYEAMTFNALHAAASSGNEALISFLLDQGFVINYPTPQGWTPLFIAARDGRAQAAKLLVFFQADLNAQTDLGATALLMALTQPFPSEDERKDLLLYMLKRGADANLLTAENHSPLYYTLLEEKPELAELLCRFGGRLTPAEKEALSEAEKNELGWSAEQRTACGF